MLTIIKAKNVKLIKELKISDMPKQVSEKTKASFFVIFFEGIPLNALLIRSIL